MPNNNVRKSRMNFKNQMSRADRYSIGTLDVIVSPSTESQLKAGS